MPTHLKPLGRWSISSPKRMLDEIAVSPYFLETDYGSLFVIEYAPRNLDSDVPTVIVIPPFAEEMNRCRKMMSLQAQSFARNGIRAVLFDLYGTGDSGGDFSDASWQTWCDNIASVLSRVVDTSRGAVSFLAIRFGALVLYSCHSELSTRAGRVVLWSPCTSGSTFLRQFLRIRIAAQMGGNDIRKESLADLMERFESGESVEVAGYEISPDLARSMSLATLSADNFGASPPVHWFETVSSPDAPPPVASKALIDELHRSHAELTLATTCGDRFWNSVEITTNPSLVEATTAVFAEARV